jgi:hypothetical protein
LAQKFKLRLKKKKISAKITKNNSEIGIKIKSDPISMPNSVDFTILANLYNIKHKNIGE